MTTATISQLTLPAPAKLNLFLHITGQQPDGYHQLQTIFQFLDIYDTLDFALNDSGAIRFTCDHTALSGIDNLVVKAATLLQQRYKPSQGVDIHLQKVLPMGGGVGGGSSDCATTLLALNQLWQLHLPLPELAQIGLTLGADVPVFIYGQGVFAEGIGDVFSPCDIPEQWYLLAHPSCHISTRAIFSHPDLPRNTGKISPERYQFSETRNDCETLVKKHYPKVANTIARLLEYAPTRMTGTGACVFSVFDSQRQAQTAANALASTLGPDVSLYVTQGKNYSLAHTSLHQVMAKSGDKP